MCNVNTNLFYFSFPSAAAAAASIHNRSMSTCTGWYRFLVFRFIPPNRSAALALASSRSRAHCGNTRVNMRTRAHTRTHTDKGGDVRPAVFRLARSWPRPTSPVRCSLPLRGGVVTHRQRRRGYPSSAAAAAANGTRNERTRRRRQISCNKRVTWKYYLYKTNSRFSFTTPVHAYFAM